MFETAKRRHAYDERNTRRSVRWIWQAPGHYHVVMIQAGNRDWVGYWSSVGLGKLPSKAALAEFLDYATHVVDNARKLGMVEGDAPVTIYAFHEAQMGDHRRILGIPDVKAGDGAWMEIKHRHPFVPDSYTRMSEFDEFGEMDYADLSDEIHEYADMLQAGEGMAMSEADIELMEELMEAAAADDDEDEGLSDDGGIDGAGPSA